MIRSNYHTHTAYCDGNSTAGDYAEYAISAGFHSIGFSGHGFVPFEEVYYGMNPETEARYRNTIISLKNQYRGRLDIYLGLENDSVNMHPREKYDYTIGSVHNILCGGRYYSVDSMAEIVSSLIAREFDGDGLAFAEAYFGAVRAFASENRADILGHIDLVRRFNTSVEKGAADGGYKFFDENSARYRRAAEAALEQAVRSGYIIEVSTGPLKKKISKETYPSDFLLKYARSLGARVMVNSDAHYAGALNYAFDRAEAALRNAGFEERWELSPGGFTPVLL